MSIPEITIANVSTAIGIVSTSFNIYKNREHIYNGLLTAGMYVDNKLDTEFFKGSSFYNTEQSDLIKMRVDIANREERLNESKMPQIKRKKNKRRR